MLKHAVLCYTGSSMNKADCRTQMRLLLGKDWIGEVGRTYLRLFGEAIVMIIIADCESVRQRYKSADNGTMPRTGARNPPQRQLQQGHLDKGCHEESHAGGISPPNTIRVTFLPRQKTYREVVDWRQDYMGRKYKLTHTHGHTNARPSGFKKWNA